MLMTPPWITSVITVTRRQSGLRIARLSIHVSSLAHARRVQRARGVSPTSTLITNVSRIGSRNGGNQLHPYSTPSKQPLPPQFKIQQDVE